MHAPSCTKHRYGDGECETRVAPEIWVYPWSFVPLVNARSSSIICDVDLVHEHCVVPQVPARRRIGRLTKCPKEREQRALHGRVREQPLDGIWRAHGRNSRPVRAGAPRLPQPLAAKRTARTLVQRPYLPASIFYRTEPFEQLCELSAPA